MLRIGVRCRHFLFVLLKCKHSLSFLCRAFATYETGEPIDSEREHIEPKILDEYKEKLVVDNKILQDLLDIKMVGLERKMA